MTATSGLATEGTAPLSLRALLSGTTAATAVVAAPVFDHYYFAVLVDAFTGQQATWNEDMSGLLTRDCAATSPGPH